MTKYILKRLGAGIISLFFLVTITFFMMYAMPGSPFAEGGDAKVPQAVIDRMNEKYGLNDPVYVQYGRYLKGLLQGDLGISYKHANRNVNDLISHNFPLTMKLGLVTAGVSLVIGVALGIAAAVKKNKLVDWLARALATVGVSVPLFVIAVLFLYTFTVRLGLLPGVGLTSSRHYVLPVAALSLNSIAYITRMMRSSMLDALGQDYIRTARAKGVKEIMVVAKHALRNAVLPILAYLGTMLASLLSGSFVVERIFTIPGIGPTYINSITDRDYTVVMGLTIFFGFILTVCNIFTDILMAFVDPRVKIYD